MNSPQGLFAIAARRESWKRLNLSFALEALERLSVIALCVIVMLAVLRVMDSLTKPNPELLQAQPSAKDYEVLESRVESLEKRLQKAERKAYQNSHPAFAGMVKKGESK